jgi:hypothetical protein
MLQVDMLQPDAADDAIAADMLLIPGGTFRMGSDRHYPEEAPVHRVTVDAFRIDKTPVTNRQFKAFVLATGRVTVAEIVPDAKDYPGALPDMLYAGSLVFSPPTHPVNVRDWNQWWTFLRGANWRHPYGPKSNINVLDNHPVVHIGRARICRPKRSGSSRPVVASIKPNSLGATNSRRVADISPIPGRATFRTRTCATTVTSGPLRSTRFRRTVMACLT